MTKDKQSSLVMYLDFSNQALKFDVYSAQFNLQQIIQQCISIIQSEANQVSDISIITNESIKFIPKFLLDQQSINEYKIETIELILNKQKQVFLKKISGKHMKKKAKKNLYMPSFDQIIYQIEKMIQYYTKQVKMVLILDYNQYLDDDIDSLLQYQDYDKNKLQIKENQGPIGKLQFQNNVKKVLSQKHIEIYKSFKKKISFTQKIEQERQIDTQIKIMQENMQIGSFQIEALDMKFYIICLQSLNWKICNSIIDDQISLEYKDNQFDFFMKIDQDQKSVIVYSSLAKKYTFHNFMKYLKQIGRFVVAVINKQLKQNPLKYVKILKNQKLQFLRQVFRFQYIYFFIDDYMIPQQVDKYLNDFLDYLNEIKVTQIYQNWFLVNYQNDIFLITIAKVSRNLFSIEIIDLQFENPEKSNLEQLKKILKSKIQQCSNQQILILSNKLRSIFQICQNYKNISNSIKLKYASEYHIQNFPYQLYQSLLEKNQMIEADTTFFKKKASHLFFYKNYIEEAITRHCKNRKFYLFINKIKKKFQLIFFKTFKSKNQNLNYAKHYILFFIIKYQNGHIQNIKSFIRTENLSKNLCPLILLQIKSEVKSIVDQIELPNIMLQVYYQLLNNIKKNIISTPKDAIKKQLRFLKFDVPLKFFKLQDSKLEPNKQPNFEQKLKLLNLLERFTMNKNAPIERIRSSNKITDDDLQVMIKISVFDQIIELQSFSDEGLNKNLLNSYIQTLSKYADHKYNFQSNQKQYFLKFMHPEAFSILYFDADLKPNQKINLYFCIICLKCFKENLGKILCLLQDDDFGQKMKILQDNLECKFRDQIKGSKKINNFYTGKMLSNLHFLFQVDFNLFFKQKLQNQQNFSKIFSELSKSSTSTDDLSQSLTFTKILQIQNEKGFFLSDELMNSLKQIFDLIYNCFFVKINTEEKNQKGYFYLLNTNDQTFNFDLLSKNVTESPIIKQLETNFATFISYIKQISNNINFFLIQIQLHVQKNFKLSLNDFIDVILALKKVSHLDNAKIQFHFSKNFVKKKDNKISQDLYQQIKLSPYKNELLKNKYYYNIYYTSFYIYEFDVIRKKISQIIMSVLESFFSCVYLELFLLNPQPTNTNSYKMLCKNLENCKQIFIINYQNLPKENFNLIENVYKKLKRMSKYVLEKIGKNKQSIKGISIIPLKTNDKFVLNYVFQKTKVEILIYESLTWDQESLKMCNQCKNFLNCLSSEPKTTYFSILQKILSFSCLNQLDEQEIKNHQKFTDKNQCCIQLCNTLEDILNIIYEKNAKNLLEKILYNKIKDLNKFLEQSDRGSQSRNQPFLKIIDIKKLYYMKFDENINLYESLIHDQILEIYKKEDDLFFRIIDGESYLLKIEKDDTTEKDTQTQIIIIYFYGVKNDQSTLHIQKIYDQIKERVNNILRSQILRFLPHITLMNQNLKIIKNIYYNYYDHQFSIRIPNVNRTLLVLYFSQNLQKYFNPIQGQLDNIKQNKAQSYNFDLQELNIKNEKILKYFLIPQSEDFQFLSKVDGNRMIKDESIFLLNIQKIDLPFFYSKYLDTRDGHFVHGLFTEDFTNNKLKLNDFFHISDKQLQIKKNKFYKKEEEFKLCQQHCEGDQFINFNIQTQKQSSNEDQIMKKIYHLLKCSFQDYFIELLMSLYFIRDQNRFQFKKSFTDFVQLLTNFKDQKKNQGLDIDNNFQFIQIKNAYFRTYTFQSFLEITKIITDKIEEQSFYYKIYYIYQNEEFEDKLQIIESNFNTFQEYINFYFEERDQLFKNKELNFKFLIVPGDIQFDYTENTFKKFIQKRKNRFSEDNIFLPTNREETNQRMSVNVLNKSLIKKKQTHVGILSSSMNKTSNQYVEKSVREKESICANYLLLQEHKYNQRKIYKEEQEYNYKKTNVESLPSRRFFLLMEFKNRKIDLFTYNIKQVHIQEINEKIQSYMNLTRLKNDLQKQISLQKLGINTVFDIYQDVFQNQSTSNEYYLKKIQEAQQIDPAFNAKHFTNIIEIVFKEGINNKGLVYIMQDEVFVQKIVRDFGKIQFYLINAYESQKVNLTAFYQQRTKNYSIDNLMQNFFKLTRNYFEKRIFEERLKQTLTISNQNFGNLNYFLNELESKYSVEFPFFYMDYYYFKNKTNDDIQSFSEVIQKEKFINVQRNVKRLIYFRWPKKIIQVFQIRKISINSKQQKIPQFIRT